jgi:hypothetical protein
MGMGPGDTAGPAADRGSGTRPNSGVAATSTSPRGGAGVPIIETIVSPFHCLYQDALELHTQSRLRASRSEAEASRLARSAVLAYLAAAEALAHQAVAELASPALTGGRLADPDCPRPLAEIWAILPALSLSGPVAVFDPEAAPWPAFRELLALREGWLYPGAAAARRAYYIASGKDGAYEPLAPHQAAAVPGLAPDRLRFPRTGLPRDPYALRPAHLDTVRAVLDAAVTDLDRRMAGALMRDGRHRVEPVRLLP